MRNEKELRHEVYNVVKSAGLLNGSNLESVLENGQIFTKAYSIGDNADGRITSAKIQI